MSHLLPASPGVARSYHYFAILTACFTFMLIIVGALVTGNEAGLAVPDWPLSYGSLTPPWVGNIRYEHGHRMVAAFVGLLTIVLATWVWKKDTRQFVRKLGLLSLGIVVTQGIVGGITVLWYLPAPVSILHACLAQTFFCSVVSLAWLSSPSWNLEPNQGVKTKEKEPQLCMLSLWTTGTVYLQLLLGAIFRHTKSGISLHLLGALVVTLLSAWLIIVIYRSHQEVQSLVRLAALLGILILVQLFFGVVSLVLRWVTVHAVQPELPVVIVTTAHVALGALILANSLIVTFESLRISSGGQRALSWILAR